jgi:hypothetical protein
VRLKSGFVKNCADATAGFCGGRLQSPRARLAHGYHSVEGAILWDEAAVSIRDIRSTITVMLRGLGAP